jgi:hypothetical protein
VLRYRLQIMPPPRVRPARLAGERAQLIGWLDLQRSIVHWKCEGLADEDAHRAVLPASPDLTMAGLVSHLRWVEHLWFEIIMEGGPAEQNPHVSGEQDADMRVRGIPIGDLLADYDAQCVRSAEIVATHSLGDLSAHHELTPEPVSLRWILFHMVEETARHAGHADAIRELVDGVKGHY